MAEFKNSIAQSNVQFPIETVIEPVAGENYTRALIFMHVGLASENFNGTPPVAGDKIELDSASYGSVAKGLLKSWLVPYFTAAQAALCAVVVYDTPTESEGGANPATAPLSEMYEKFKYWAYFKFGLAAAADYAQLQKDLALLCIADPLYSQLWVGTSDGDVLTRGSALVSELKGTGADVRVVYNPDGNINPALAQLGDTLGAANSTGTPVGNDVDMHAFSTIGASGSETSDGERTNLSPTQKTALNEQKIGYNTYVGDGTENVVTEGSLTLQGGVVGAQWVKSYIEYMCKVRTANEITRRNKFRNNAQYQSILCILADVVKPFVDFGRLEGFKITAPLFSQLPKSADAISVPNAWEATYVDKVREVTVYGTLYITQPSK